MTAIKKYTTVPVIAALFIVGGAIAGYASLAAADNEPGGSSFMGMGMGRHLGPHVGGTIQSISGSTLTITGKDGMTYTVDASNAKVHTFVEGSGPKDGSLADLKVGDEIGVRGTVSGSNVTAADIMSGIPEGGFGHHGKMGRGVAGEVTAINGNTITVKSFRGDTFTIEAGSATVNKMVAGSLSDIQVGDKIGVHGTVSGQNVTAQQIMDDLPAPLNQ